MKKRRLLLAVTHAGFGGVAKHVIDLAKHVTMFSNWEVDIACGVQKKDLLETYRQVANRLITVEGLVREISPINDVRAYNNIREIIQGEEYDVVHAHGAKAGILFRRAAFKCGIPNIYTHHLVVYKQFKNMLNPLYKYLETKASNWCDYVVVVTEENKRVLYSDGVVPENKLKVVYNGILEIEPQYTRHSARKKIGISEDTFLIVTVSRLDKPKDPLTLVRGFREICKEKKNLRLAIVGDGTLKPMIVDELTKNGLINNVLMPGFVNDVDVYLAAADVFCLATEKEGLPIAILEAMKYSLPIVASSVDGIPEQVKNGWNGYLIPVNDDQTFFDKIRVLYTDQKQRAILGRNSRKFLEDKFTAQANYDGLVALYDAIAIKN